MHLVELEVVERFALGKTDAFEAFAQIVFLQILVAANRDLGDLRALLHGHHEDVALVDATFPQPIALYPDGVSLGPG